MLRSPVKALAALEPAIDAFTGTAEVTITDESLCSFLSATAESELNASDRLIALASTLEPNQCANGWQGLSQIYEYANRRDQQNRGITVTWFLAAQRCYESSELQAGDRLSAASDAQKVLDMLRNSDPHNPAAAYMFGLLYYKHPLRMAEEAHCVNAALEWFNRAVEESSSAEDLSLPQMYVGHCLYDLGRWKDAISRYEAIDTSCITKEENDELGRRIVECRSKI